MIVSSPERKQCFTEIGWPVQPGYFDLKTLAAYSCCSVRWLRDRLVDRVHPLPHYRVGGKLLVKRDEFDSWMRAHRIGSLTTQLNEIVESVVAKVSQPHRAA
jgi:hypothetical protein